MLQLHKADGSGDGAAPAIAIRREDYTAPAYLVDTVDLDISIAAGATTVTATLAIYLDLYNIFQNLLALLGIFGGERD